MVEDEFLSTARTFTSHLHHAEYQRLKRLARTRPAPAARPVDSITKMREDTKRQKDAEAQEKRAKGLLGRLNGAVKPKGSDDESDLDDLLEDRGDGPGVGTALGELMKQSPKKNLTSLSGLHCAKASTRAAAGFKRAKSPSKEKKSDIFKEFSRSKKIEKPDANMEGNEAETDDGDSDDLDAPVTRPPKWTEPIKQKKDVQQRKPLKAVRPPKPPREPSPPEPSRSPSSSPPLRKPRDALLERAKARQERERKEKEKRGIAMDEIPVFLV